MGEPEVVRVEMRDGSRIGVLSWPADPGTAMVLAIHGITANAWSWAPVARHLAGAARLVAIDLRGRGLSAGVPGPTGMRRHADDVATVIEQLGSGPVVVAGHSMGTYVALMAAERHPALVATMVLVDGGIALPVPDGIPVQDVLDATIGPAIARLRQTWPDAARYRAMWEAHPALAEGLTPDIERSVMADLVPAHDGDGMRSCVREDAVRFDGAELLTDDEVRTALDRHAEPLTIVRAETGLLATPPPLIPVEYEDRYPQHRWITVPGSNHYTVLVGEDGAAAVAGAVLDVTAQA